jgi:hypothetical protein
LIPRSIVVDGLIFFKMNVLRPDLTHAPPAMPELQGASAPGILPFYQLGWKLLNLPVMLPHPNANERVSLMLKRTRLFAAPLVVMTLALFAFTALVTIMAPTPASAADAPKLLGKYDDWAAYTYGTGKDRICYVLSEPKTMLPKDVNRGDVYFMVTHRPGRNIHNEISMRIGYPFSKTSRPFAKIDGKSFQMFSGVAEGGEHQMWAWLDNAKDEDRMVQALRAGSSMVIKGTSSRDTLTTDTYSLKGSSNALTKIDQACK